MNTTSKNHPHDTFTIQPVAKPMRKTIEILNGGANRGALANLQAFADFNALSERVEIVPVSIDPVPGRAATLAARAAVMSVRVIAREGRVEDVSRELTEAPLILNVDRASAMLPPLEHARRTGRAVLAYLLILLPSGRLWGIRIAVGTNDAQAIDEVIGLLGKLVGLTERGGSTTILGEAADPGHRLLEPLIRQWFAKHTVENLGKIAAGIEPVNSPIEITADGRETVSLHVVTRASWGDPKALAADVLDHPNVPLARGTRFVIAEITPEGIRFHEVSRRTDGRTVIESRTAMDASSVAQVESAHRDALAREVRSAERAKLANEAMSRAVRETVTRSNPVRSTD